MNSIVATLAVAQDAAARGPSSYGFLLQLLLIFAIFYFLFIRPQQKKTKEHQNLIMSVKRGDEIVTAGGIVGEIVHIAQGLKDGQVQASMSDRITIKSGESRLIIERGRITHIVPRGGGGESQ